MEYYKGIYEHPSSQAAIQALPNKVDDGVPHAKVKRSWGNILRFHKRSKKNRDNPVSSSDLRNVPTAHRHVYTQIPNFYSSYDPPVHNQFSPNVYSIGANVSHDNYQQYRRVELKKSNINHDSNAFPNNNLSQLKENVGSNVNGKNTVRYTEWFGTVVGRKPPIRPSLPAFHNPPQLQVEEAVPSLSTWSNYANTCSTVRGQATIPTIISVQNPKVCVCPDQLFSTKTQKKKKCKNCGRKYGTFRNSTLIHSSSRIRPVIPPSFYNVSPAPSWALSPSNNSVYAQPMPVAVKNGNSRLFIDNTIREEPCHSSPETTRSTNSGGSNDSSRSSNTLVQDSGNMSSSLSPSYIHPESPINRKHKLKKKFSFSNSKENKRSFVFETVKSACNYNSNNYVPCSNSDTEDLSDNSLEDIFENTKMSNFGNKKYMTQNYFTYDGNDYNGVNFKNYSRKTRNISYEEVDHFGNKVGMKPPREIVLQYNNNAYPNMSPMKNKFPRPVLLKSPHANSKILNCNKTHKSDDQGTCKDELTKESLDMLSNLAHSNLISSHNVKKDHFRKQSLSEIEISDEESFKSPRRDSTNVVNIAGQQILLNHKNSRASPKAISNNLDCIKESDNQARTNSSLSVRDWDSLRDYISNYQQSESNEFEDSQSITLSSNNRFENEMANNEREYLVTDCNGKETMPLDDSCATTEFPTELYSTEVEATEQSLVSKCTKMQSLSELQLLEVKSILKRPNSLDTSSEAEADFYLPTTNQELKEKIYKKKCVQFVPPQNLNMLNQYNEIGEREILSCTLPTREKLENNDNPRVHRSLSEENVNELNLNSEDHKSFVSDKNDMNSSAVKECFSFGSRGTLQNHHKKGSANIRRTHSQREATNVNEPSFKDTYRLRQNVSRPSVVGKGKSFSGNKSIYSRGLSPLRPSVPPPPPPCRFVNDSSCKPPQSFNSPSDSPSPPPLPTSSPPPLDFTQESGRDEHEYISSLNTNTVELLFNSDNKSGETNNPFAAGSKNDNYHINSIRTRIHGKKSEPKIGSTSNHSSKQSVKAHEQNFTNDRTSSPIKSKLINSREKVTFSTEMLDEIDVDERLSDHIYEELPSISSYSSDSLQNFQERSIFDGASKYEILEFLQVARHRVNIAPDDDDEALSNAVLNSSLIEEENSLDSKEVTSLHHLRCTEERSSNRSSNSGSSGSSALIRTDSKRLSAGKIERTDSGVGSETSKPVMSRSDDSKTYHLPFIRSLSINDHHSEDLVGPCDDCDISTDLNSGTSGLMYSPLVCRRCLKRRQERKEILMEIVETEIKYGKDLSVMMEQFCRPMRVAGLLSSDQMDRIFLNIDKLIVYNRHFCLELRNVIRSAVDTGDGDMLTVNVAKLFLHAIPMLHEFQNYCVRQGAASILLQNLEKEKELLRIFLKVSQMENTLLRRMNLHSFLMVPVQRVTKYPLLLARLYKATPPSSPSREDCRRAREKIESYLVHINNETKELSPSKIWRKISMSVSSNSPVKWTKQPTEYNSTLRLRTVVLDVLEWSTEDAFIVREGRLLCLPPESSNWTRRGKVLRMAAVQVVLVTLGRPKFHMKEKVTEDGLLSPFDLGVEEAVVLAFKDHRLTKSALIREPWFLSKTVVTWDDEDETECFELTDIASKDTFIFKDRGSVGTEEWFRSIQFHALSVGSWRRRRPALANIMINGANRS